MKRELIEIGITIRVENGPARKTGVATEELLDNKNTAEHYQEGAKDAMGKQIVLGEEMTYLHFRGDLVWYVYQLEETPIDGPSINGIRTAKLGGSGELTPEIVAEWYGVDPDHILTDPWRVMRFMPRGDFPTKDDAVAFAKSLEE